MHVFVEEAVHEREPHQRGLVPLVGGLRLLGRTVYLPQLVAIVGPHVLDLHLARVHVEPVGVHVPDERPERVSPRGLALVPWMVVLP